ncbi:MAG: hypothetical protein WCJ19_01435 [bacterium]
MKQNDRQMPKGWYRLFEILEPISVWAIVLFIIIGSYFFPYPVAVFVLIFNVYFLYTTIKVTSGVILNTIRIKIASNINWVGLLSQVDDLDTAINDLKDDIVELKSGKLDIFLYAKDKNFVSKKVGAFFRKIYITRQLKAKLNKLQELKKTNVIVPKSNDIKHVFIIATAFEPPQLIARLVNSITNQSACKNYKDNMLVLVGQESANKDYLLVREELLKQVDTSKIRDIWFNMHDLDPETETKGKHSNVNSIARNFFPKIVNDLGWDPKLTMVHIVDTPIVLDPNYAAYMAYEFATQPEDREYKIYSSCILFYNNIWDIPLPNRLSNTLSSLWNINTLSKGYQFVPISSYTTTIWLAENVDYWAKTVIPEDHHYFYNSFYHFGDKVMSVPIFLFTGKDAAQAKTYFRTYKNQYNQFQRWAWGISDIGFVIDNTLHAKNVPLFSRLRRMKEFLKIHFLWPTSWFLTILGTNLPFMLNPDFRRTLTGAIIPDIISYTVLAFIFFLLVILIVDVFVKPKKVGKMDNPYIRIISLIQWISFPLVSFMYSAVPALDAHTRLMFGKYLQYKITEKVAPKKDNL